VIGDILQPTHLLFVLVVALIVLGPKRLPEVGRSLGRGLRDFRSAISGQDEEHSPEMVQQLQSGEGEIAAREQAPTTQEQAPAPQEQAPPAQPQPEPTAVSAAQNPAPQEPAGVSAEQRSTDSA
jgi:TatA/E family protein of Tat protein translocase